MQELVVCFKRFFFFFRIFVFFFFLCGDTSSGWMWLCRHGSGRCARAKVFYCNSTFLPAGLCVNQAAKGFFSVRYDLFFSPKRKKLLLKSCSRFALVSNNCEESAWISVCFDSRTFSWRIQKLSLSLCVFVQRCSKESSCNEQFNVCLPLFCFYRDSLRMRLCVCLFICLRERS